MQIHELFKSKQALEEGVWDTVKSTAGRVGSAVASGAKTYGRNLAKDMGFDIGTAANAAQLSKKVSALWNQQVAQMQQATPGQPINPRVYETQLEQFINQVFYKDKLGFADQATQQAVANTVRSITAVKDNPTAVNTQFSKLAQDIAARQKAAPTTRGPITVMPGQRIAVAFTQPGQLQPSFYYKTSQGWTNATGESITNPNSIKYLDSIAPTQGRLEQDPTFTAPTAQFKRATRKRGQ